MAVATIVPKPKIEEEVRASVVETLRAALDRAEKGEVTAVLVIMFHDDGWSDEHSATMNFADVIGRLELVKQNWIAQYFACDCGK